MSESHSLRSFEDKKLIDGKIEVRPDTDGTFDELVMYGDGKQCLVHAEMMNDACLWIAFYPPGETERRVCMWIGIKGKKLHINADED